VLNQENDDNIGKFNARVDEGVFLGYYNKSKDHLCYNKRLCKIINCVDVKVDEELPLKSKQPRFISLPNRTNNEDQEKKKKHK